MDMEDIAISVRHIAKSFRRYDRPSDRLKEILLPRRQRYREFQALRDVSIDIPRGQTLGIVGRNGSGKSTLLQIIVGTLQPSAGDIDVRGRISALLELGSGFNPEFTGRQNVFFNGQILGLSHAQIEARFDEIAAFADIGDFLDQPAKTYSSGMFVRLAFAVATSVEPDILVVDEALAVGDEAFQRKCFARIESLQAQGCTTLFVSHAASKVVELCDRALLLDHGEAIMTHHPKFVIDQYHKLIYAPADRYQTLRDQLKAIPDAPLWPDSPRSNSGSWNQKKSDIDIVKNTTNGHARGKASPNATDPNTADREEATPTHQRSFNADRALDVAIERDFFDPALVPTHTLSYEPRGADIRDPKLLSLDGREVNNIAGRHDYVYTYEVEFHRAASDLRFGMLIKTVSGLELGGASFPAIARDVTSVEAHTCITVRFRFSCCLNPGVYFLNAGVSGIVDGQFTYLARGIDIAMFRVLSDSDSFASEIVDLSIVPHIAIAPTRTVTR
jgi:lipopolysaccharide transport system ATP-binding protein